MKWRIALRYLTARKSHSVINTIASVSLLAVAVPVAAMVILLSVFNGFEGLVRDLYKAVDADIEIHHKGGIDTSSSALKESIEGVEGVEKTTFILEREAVLSYRDRFTMVTLRGVDDHYNEVLPIADHISLGAFTPRLGEIDMLLLGEAITHELGMYAMAAGDVDVISLGGASIGALLPMSGVHREKLPVAGTFVIDQQHASSLAITSLHAATRIFGCEGRADAILVKVAKGAHDKRVRELLATTLGEEYNVVLREEKNKSFYAIMRYEKWGIFFISLLVLLVASLSIIGSVIMLILEKQNERPTLLALGADEGFVRGIFVREGLLISGVGDLIGIVIGVAVVMLQEQFGFVKLPN
jgi:lipoprotein-releasing system permease protein